MCAARFEQHNSELSCVFVCSVGFFFSSGLQILDSVTTKEADNLD